MSEELKTGYKKTKLGWIPEDWELKKVNEIFNFLPTNSFSRKQLSYDITIESIYNIHYGDIHATYKEAILDFEKEEAIPVIIEENSNQNAQSFLKDGDVIIADASEDYEGVGKAIELLNINEKKVLAGLHTFALRDFSNLTATGFRAYIFKNPKVSKALKVIATGSKVYGISKGNLEKFELVIPPLPEQQKIAQILSTWDKAIAKLEALIEQKQKRKQGLMQQLLTGKRRFKEFVKSDKLRDTKLGMIPEDWEVDLFSNISDLIHGYQFRAEDFVDKEDKSPGVIKIGNVKKGNIEFDDSGFINFARIKQFERFILKEGDILMSLTGNVGRVAIMPVTTRVYLQNYRVGKFQPKNKIDKGFLFHALTYDRTTHQLEVLCNQAAQANFGKQDFDKVFIAIPTLPEQQQISKTLFNSGVEISKLQTQLKQLKKQKKGLMQKLLTGEVRVNVKDEIKN